MDFAFQVDDGSINLIGLQPFLLDNALNTELGVGSDLVFDLSDNGTDQSSCLLG